jgi:outer membrane protein
MLDQYQLLFQHQPKLNRMRKLLVLVTFLSIGLGSLQAQAKYGHLNMGNLIAIMPEALAANDSLEVIQAQMVAEGEAAAAQLEKDYVAYIKEARAGNLTPVKQEEQEQQLNQRQQELQQLEQIIVQVIQQQRNKLLAPILEKAQNAIDEVAKENGFQLVFDTSIFGAVMYAEETVDLMPLVKAKLGLEE